MSRPFFPLLALSIMLASGCGPLRDDDDDAAGSACNGERDIGEFETDDVFDADGDGFFDPDDPGCAATYSSEELDCDDSDSAVNPDATEMVCNEQDDDCDPDTADENDLDLDNYSDCDGDCDDGNQSVNPGAEEIPCNGIDEDCNLDDGEPCDTNYSGAWSLSSEVSYSCDGGAVQVGFSSVAITHEDSSVSVVPDNCSTCTGPTSLQGSFFSDTQFEANQTVDPSSSCEKRYSFVSTFTGPDDFSGSLTINFIGADCVTVGCSGQNFTFTGSR